MQHIHPDHARLLHNADLMVANEQRQKHQVRSSTARRLRAALLRRRRRDLGRFDPQWDICEGLTSTARMRFEDYFRLVEVEAGTTIGEQGSRVRNLVLVVSGQVGVSVDGTVVGVLEPGAHFGSLPLLSDEPAPVRHASFVCLTPTTVGTIFRPMLRQVMNEFPEVGEQLRETARIRGAYFAGRRDAAPEAAYPMDHMRA